MHCNGRDNVFGERMKKLYNDEIQYLHQSLRNEKNLKNDSDDNNVGIKECKRRKNKKLREEGKTYKVRSRRKGAAVKRRIERGEIKMGPLCSSKVCRCLNRKLKPVRKFLKKIETIFSYTSVHS